MASVFRRRPLIQLDKLEDWSFSGLSLVNTDPEKNCLTAGKEANVLFQLLNTTQGVVLPSDLLFLAHYNDTTPSFDLDYVRDGGSLTGTPVGSPTIDTVSPKFGAGNLLLNGIEHVTYNGAGIVDGLVQTGCISMWVRPGYSGNPGTMHQFYSSHDGVTDNKNWAGIRHLTNGNITFILYDATGSLLLNIAASFSPDGTSWYHLEFNWDVQAGSPASRGFINGSQVGSTDNTSGTRSGNSQFMAVGRSWVTPIAMDFEADEVMGFDKVQHTADFTPPTLELPGSGPADPVDQSSVNVWVGGTKAVENGSPINGFGATLTPSGDNDRDLDVDINPPSDFSSEQVVQVRVVADVTGDGYDIDETYSFTVEDYVSPTLSSAKGWQPGEIWIQFSEAVQYDATAVTGAVDPSNYAVEYVQTDSTRAAVSASISSVVAKSSTVFLLYTDIVLTPGVTYKVTVSNVEDLSGNAVQSPNDSQEFTSYDFRKPGREFDGFQLYEMFSDKDRARDEDHGLKKLSSAFQDSIDFALWRIDEIETLEDPDECPEGYLNQWLYDKGNPFSFVTDEIEKRKLAFHIEEMREKYGTGPGIVQAVELIMGLTCEIVSDNSEVWILGESELGTETILGGSGVNAFAYWVKFTSGLTDAQRDRVGTIALIMQDSQSKYMGTIEP